MSQHVPLRGALVWLGKKMKWRGRWEVEKLGKAQKSRSVAKVRALGGLRVSEDRRLLLAGHPLTYDGAAATDRRTARAANAPRQAAGLHLARHVEGSGGGPKRGWTRHWVVGFRALISAQLILTLLPASLSHSGRERQTNTQQKPPRAN